MGERGEGRRVEEVVFICSYCTVNVICSLYVMKPPQRTALPESSARPSYVSGFWSVVT